MQLDVCLEANPLQQVGDRALVGVPLQPLPQVREVEVGLDGQREVERYRAGSSLEGEVPNDTPSPGQQVALPDGQRLGPQQLAPLPLTLDAEQLVQRLIQPVEEAAAS